MHERNMHMHVQLTRQDVPQASRTTLVGVALPFSDLNMHVTGARVQACGVHSAVCLYNRSGSFDFKLSSGAGQVGRPTPGPGPRSPSAKSDMNVML